MKSFAKLLAVAVALSLPTLAAHADPITGYLQLAGGVTAYTPTTITFSNSGNSVFDGGGTLATDFDGGNLVFGPTAGSPYTVDGANYLNTLLFTVTNPTTGHPGVSGDVLSFTLTNITAFSYNADGLDGLEGSGTGNLTVFDPTDNQTSTVNGVFTLSSQRNPVTGLTEDVSFSSTVGVAPTPEPSSLLLLGTGLLGSAGALYRRNRTSAS